MANPPGLEQEPASDVLAAVMAQAPPLAKAFQKMIRPVRQNRDKIRDFLQREDAILPMPAGGSIYSVGAVDGACICSSLAIADHLATLTVGVLNDPNRGIQMAGHRSWSDLRPHSADASILTTAVMMSQELSLLRAFDPEETIVIIDGSHVTSLVALNMALASPEAAIREHIIELGNGTLVEDVEYAAATETVVACPKADSSNDLWTWCAAALDIDGAGFPDKVLANLLLDPGEMLRSERLAPSWERLYSTQGRIVDPAAKALADRLREATEGIRGGPVQVFHAKPRDATTVLRVEVKPGASNLDVDEIVQALCDDTAPPHLQEPLSQHLADIHAKGITATSKVQMENAFLDLAESGEVEHLEQLMRHYRTTI